MNHSNQYAIWNLLEWIPSGKGHPIWTSLGKFYMDPHITEMWSIGAHRESAHWISYQLLWLGHPIAWGSPLSAHTLLALLNFGPVLFTYRKSPRDQTGPFLHRIKVSNTKTIFLVPHQHHPSLFMLILPFPSHLSWLVTNHETGLVVFDFWRFK